MVRAVITFGQYLEALIAREGIAEKHWAARVDCSYPTLSGIIHDRRSPPPEKLEEWAETLELDGVERQVFMDLAALRHLPEEFRARFVSLSGLDDPSLVRFLQASGTPAPAHLSAADRAFARASAQARATRKKPDRKKHG